MTKRGNKYYYEDKLLTIKELAQISPVSLDTIYKRIKRGMSVEDAISKENKISYNGKTQSIREWAKEIGICHEALRQRLLKGWSLHKALTTAKKND